MADKDQAAKTEQIVWMDNLRTFMIFLVVMLHCGLVYDSSGVPGLFWIVYDFNANDVVGPLNRVLDIFVMAAIFFVAGYLTPMSLKKRTAWQFIKNKIRRLIIPFAIAVLTLIPLYRMIFLYSRGMPQTHWTSYLYWNYPLISQNWLWFLPVLFVFDMAYVLLSRIKVSLAGITLKRAVAAVFLIGVVYSVCVDRIGLQGWTKNAVINFQNERLLIYFLIFLLGALCWQLKVFDTEWKDNRKAVIMSVVALNAVLLYSYFTVNTQQSPDRVILSPTVDTLILWLSFHLSLLSLLALLVYIFRVLLNKQNTLIKALNRNSYAVYIIHVVVLGCLALPLLNLEIPSLLKFVILTVATYALCNVIITAYRARCLGWRNR